MKQKLIFCAVLAILVVMVAGCTPEQRIAANATRETFTPPMETTETYVPPAITRGRYVTLTETLLMFISIDVMEDTLCDMASDKINEYDIGLLLLAGDIWYSDCGERVYYTGRVCRGYAYCHGVAFKAFEVKAPDSDIKWWASTSPTGELGTLW